ncbi:MAG: acyl-CoA thioesterase [Desulfohalobiaceae bacterium]
MPRVKVELPKKFLFSTDIPIRITDINYGAHLGNDSLLSLLHEARVRFLEHFGLQELDIQGLGILIADAALQYKAQAFRGDVLRVEIGLDDVGRKGCDIVYFCSNLHSGQEIARAKTGIVFFDPQKQQVARIPDLFLQSLGLHQG